MPQKITVKFKYFCNANCQCQPTASTCDPSITFPLHYDTYYAFCQSMSSALVEGCGFGFVQLSYSLVVIHNYFSTFMVDCNNIVLVVKILFSSIKWPMFPLEDCYCSSMPATVYYVKSTKIFIFQFLNHH